MSKQPNYSASSTKALQLMQDCAKIPSSAGFVSQGWTFRDMAGFAEEMLDIGVDLLRSGVRGEWPKLSSSGQPQQPFPTDDRLLLLKSKFGDSEGDAIFNKYCKDSTMALLRPSAFLTESQLLGKSSFAKESLRQKFTFVLFVGWRKPDLSSDQELWDVEDGLLADIQSEKNIHMYVVVPLPDGINYLNIVIARPLASHETTAALMGQSAWHQRAVSISPASYSWTRIHFGTLIGDLLARRDWVIHLERKMCLQFEEDKNGIKWRFNLPLDEYYSLHRSENSVVWKGSSNFQKLLEHPLNCKKNPSLDPSTDWLDQIAPQIALQTLPPLTSSLVRCTSYLAGNAQSFYRKAFQFVAKKTGLPLVWVAPSWERTPWQNLCGSNGPTIGDGSDAECDVAFMCGAMFATASFGDSLGDALLTSILVAPRRERTVIPPAANKEDSSQSTTTLPAYQCVLIARKGLVTQRKSVNIEEFRGKRLAINEPRSWSGCRALEAFIKEHSNCALSDFFCQVKKTGSHQQSLNALISGDMDIASIDSHVLDTELELHPNLKSKIDIISGTGFESLWPAPPCVASRRLSPWIHLTIARALTSLHTDPEGKTILQEAGFATFERATPAPYRAISELLTTKKMISSRL